MTVPIMRNIKFTETSCQPDEGNAPIPAERGDREAVTYDCYHLYPTPAYQVCGSPGK